MFALFDDDQSGKITLRNLKRVAKELGEQISGACLRVWLWFVMRLCAWMLVCCVDLWLLNGISLPVRLPARRPAIRPSRCRINALHPSQPHPHKY